MRAIERLHYLLDLWKARARKHTDAEMMHRGLEKREAKDGALRWMRRDGGEGTKRLPAFRGAPAPSGGGGKRKGKGGSKAGTPRKRLKPAERLAQALGPPGTVVSPEAFADHVEAVLGSEARERSSGYISYLHQEGLVDVAWRVPPDQENTFGVARSITVRAPRAVAKPYTELTASEAIDWLLLDTWRGSERSDALGMVTAMYSKKGREKRKQWRDHFARLLHPDRNPDPRAAAAMAKVNAIYERMSDV